MTNNKSMPKLNKMLSKASNKSKRKKTDIVQNRVGEATAMMDLIVQSNLIGNVLAAATHKSSSFEPLPIIDYSLFLDNSS